MRRREKNEYPNMSGAVDLSQLVATKHQLPNLAEIEIMQKKYIAEMQHVQDWTKANEQLLRTLAVTDKTRHMYSNIAISNVLNMIIERIGISPKRIPAPVIKDIQSLVRRAINYGIYKGVHIAAGSKFEEPAMQDINTMKFMSEDEAKELESKEQDKTYNAADEAARLENQMRDDDAEQKDVHQGELPSNELEQISKDIENAG